MYICCILRVCIVTISCCRELFLSDLGLSVELLLYQYCSVAIITELFGIVAKHNDYNK